MILNFEIIALILLSVWIFILSVLLWRTTSHYNNLTKGTTEKSLKSILESVLKELKVAQNDISVLTKRCDTIEKAGFFHIQKIGLVRFNPFKDTGGDQSFILSLLDGKNTGVVISGLYSRSGTRWYAKKIVEGKGVEHELSEEEKNAVTRASSTLDMIK